MNIRHKTERILRNPSLILAGGYALGQGSAFAVQIAARYFGYHELSGIFVVVISVLSFCFQFADFGNPTYLVKDVSSGRINEAISFIKSRRVWALLICSGFSVWTLTQSRLDGLWILIIIVPFIGAICGNFYGAFLEARGAYFRLALIGVLPWFCMSLALLSFFVAANQNHAMVIVGLVTICACYISMCLSKKLVNEKIAPVKIKRFWTVMPFVLSPLGGQIWFRYVLFTISTTVGLSSLGAMGIARNIQIAILLCVGFIARPALRKYITIIATENGQMSLIGVLKSYRYAFIGASFAPILLSIFLSSIVDSDADTIQYWSLILFTIPLTLLGQAASAANQLRNGPKYILLTDYSCLAANALAFLLIVSYSPVLAIVASESVHAIALLIAYFAITYQSSKCK
jgi:O-antigen/teichoic acid export membrane protein